MNIVAPDFTVTFSQAVTSRKIDLITMCIRDNYMNDLVLVYSTTIGLHEKHPAQVNNEIRNALTHLGRAMDAQDMNEVNKQVQKAKDHFERAKKDCFKMCCITLSDRLNDTIKRIEVETGVVDGDIKRKRRTLEKMRSEANKSETYNRTGQTVKILEKIVNDFFDLEDIILDRYSEQMKSLTGFKKLRLRVNSWFQKAFMLLGMISAFVTVFGYILYLVKT